jgi:hypothetical protein
VDPDPQGSALKKLKKKMKKCTGIVFKCWISSYCIRAGDFCSLDVIRGGLGTNKMQFSKKNLDFFTTVKFYNFL